MMTHMTMKKKLKECKLAPMLKSVKNVFAFPTCVTWGMIHIVKVGPPVHNYEHEAGSYGDGFT